MCKEQIIKQWENSNLQWNLCFKIPSFISLSYKCRAQPAQRMPSQWYWLLQRVVVLLVILIGFPSPDSIPRELPTRTLGVWSEMALCASRSYRVGVFQHLAGLGLLLQLGIQSAQWSFPLGAPRGWLRGWAEAQPRSKPELPKLPSCEVSSLWYVLSLLEGDFGFWNF